MNTNTLDKPFKTYQEQLNILKTRNVIIDDEAFALKALSSFSYYTLANGYKNSFLLSPESDNFDTPIRIEELYTLHLQDSAISNILFKYILHVERFLKTRISYRIAEQYGVETNVTIGTVTNDYLSTKNYGKSKKRNNITSGLRKSLKNKYHSEVIDHYLKNRNHIPPWILATNLTFGDTVQWYSILAKDDKSYVCNEFLHSYNLKIADKKELFIKSISLLKDFRNEIAHGKRAFNATTKNNLPKNALIASVPELISSDEYCKDYGRNDFYAAIISILILVDDVFVLNSFRLDLHNAIYPFEKENVLFAGKTIYETLNIPHDIFHRFENRINNLK